MVEEGTFMFFLVIFFFGGGLSFFPFRGWVLVLFVDVKSLFHACFVG